MAHECVFNVMYQPGWEKGLEENGYMYMYGWGSSLFTWNYHNIVDQLYAHIKEVSSKNKTKKKKKMHPYDHSNTIHNTQGTETTWMPTDRWMDK